MFKEHETCETPGQCKELMECQRAFVIKQETNYEEDKPGKSSVGYAIREAICEHTEAQAAKRAAQELTP